MKILLTGPSGNLGVQITKYSPYDIIRLNREDWDRLPEILATGIDIVIHLAYDLKNKIENSPTNIIDSNLVTTTRLIEAMSRYNTPRLVFPSSCAVYGESMQTNEETACRPISVNGIVKLLNEKIIERYCSINNIKYVIYRIFNMYGGDDKFSVIYHLNRALENGTEFCLNNNGISQRDFVHIDDVAKIILKLIAVDHPYTHLNIGTGVSTRIIEIVTSVAQKCRSLRIKNAYMPEAEYSRANITKLSSLLHYNFINVLDFVNRIF